jgi:hypothetical protein
MPCLDLSLEGSRDPHPPPHADPPLAPHLSRCVLPWIRLFGRSTPRARLPWTETPRAASPHPLWCQESRTPLPPSARIRLTFPALWFREVHPCAIFGRSTPRARLPWTETPWAAPPHPLWCQESQTPLPTSPNRPQYSTHPRCCVRALLLPRTVASAISSSCRAINGSHNDKSSGITARGITTPLLSRLTCKASRRPNQIRAEHGLHPNWIRAYKMFSAARHNNPRLFPVLSIHLLLPGTPIIYTYALWGNGLIFSIDMVMVGIPIYLWADTFYKTFLLTWLWLILQEKKRNEQKYQYFAWWYGAHLL